MTADALWRCLKRRSFLMEDDYAVLLGMQRISWRINFPGYRFSESMYRASLSLGAERDEITVYELHGEIVGVLWLDTHSTQDTGHIKHLQVRRWMWGKGLGRVMLQDAADRCRRRDCRGLTLNVTKANKRAMCLYAGFGFVVIEDSGDRQKMMLDLAAFGAASGDPSAPCAVGG